MCILKIVEGTAVSIKLWRVTYGYALLVYTNSEQIASHDAKHAEIK